MSDRSPRIERFAASLDLSERFTLAKVAGGWQIYDTVRREHIGAIRKTRSGAESVLRDIQKYRAPIARFILTGSTK